MFGDAPIKWRPLQVVIYGSLGLLILYVACMAIWGPSSPSGDDITVVINADDGGISSRDIAGEKIVKIRPEGSKVRIWTTSGRYDVRRGKELIFSSRGKLFQRESFEAGMLRDARKFQGDLHKLEVSAKKLTVVSTTNQREVFTLPVTDNTLWIK